MFRQITCVLTVILASCGVFFLSAADVSGQNYSPLYDEVLKKLESLTPNNTIEVNMGVEEKHYQESFTITDETLEKLGQEGVPEEIIRKLADVKKDSYSSADRLIGAVTEKIGNDQTATYQALILDQSDYRANIVFQQDDPFELRFQVSQDSYIALMHIAAPAKDQGNIVAGGDITFLLPNRDFPDGRMEGGRVYSTVYDLNKNLTATLPKGLSLATDHMKLFCSTKKLVLAEPDWGTNGVYVVTPFDEKRLKTLLDRLQQLEQEEWSGKSLRFEIRSKGISSRGVPLPVPEGIPSDRTRKWFPPIGSAGTTGIK
jgi:hypothetical protein